VVLRRRLNAALRASTQETFKGEVEAAGGGAELTPTANSRYRDTTRPKHLKDGFKENSYLIAS
jgi:hypothetical protein